MELAEIQRILRGRDVETIAAEMVYAGWVQELAPWTTFFTGTFRNVEVQRGGFTYDVGFSEPSASRAFRRFMLRHVPGVRGFYGIERNPSREGHHVHGLMAVAANVRRKTLWKEWWERYGTNRIVPIENIGGCSAYCAKYPLTSALEWGLVNCGPAEPKQNLLLEQDPNSEAAVAERRAEADRLVARWGSRSKLSRVEVTVSV
jgi:hypothetical protein